MLKKPFSERVKKLATACGAAFPSSSIPRLAPERFIVPVQVRACATDGFGTSEDSALVAVASGLVGDAAGVEEIGLAVELEFTLGLAEGEAAVVAVT